MAVHQYDPLVSQYTGGWDEFKAAQPPQPGYIALDVCYQISDGSVIATWVKLPC